MATLFDDDPFLRPEWLGPWQYAELISLRDAACVLTYNDPNKFEGNRVIPSDARTMGDVLGQSIIVGKLQPYALRGIFGDDFNGYNEAPMNADELSPHTQLSEATTVKVSDLAAWCDSRGIAHPWGTTKMQHAAAIATYPDELRAALEAFEAVYPTPLRGRSPKGVLTEWLEKHKPELSAGARSRIATVANWQREGGAPKTPG